MKQLVSFYNRSHGKIFIEIWKYPENRQPRGNAWTRGRLSQKSGKSMDYKVTLTNPAREQLEQIIFYYLLHELGMHRLQTVCLRMLPIRNCDFLMLPEVSSYVKI